jgi:hypothetical protein
MTAHQLANELHLTSSQCKFFTEKAVAMLKQQQDQIDLLTEECNALRKQINELQ